MSEEEAIAAAPPEWFNLPWFHPFAVALRASKVFRWYRLPGDRISAKMIGKRP